MRKTETSNDTRFAALGYVPYRNRVGRMSYIRPAESGDFPRFHLYVENEDQETLHCSLHFDHMGPKYLKNKNSYEASFDTAEIVAEATRLQNS